MDTDYIYSVEWEGQAELQQMSLPEVRAVATSEFTEAEWLPPAIRTLIEVGPSFTPLPAPPRLHCTLWLPSVPAQGA